MSFFGLGQDGYDTEVRTVLAFAFEDKSTPNLPGSRPAGTGSFLPPAEPVNRDVLPASFGFVARGAVPTPQLLLAGYDGGPTISPLHCAVREHAKHNLAFRCNAPVALNVPGGNNPRKSFLAEMERETRFEVGTDIWPGDKDALTGDRLLSARDAVTGLRFTMRYLDQRGFTLGSNPCSNRSKWRWSYVCMDDAKWDKLTRKGQCEFVLNNLLSVEGGSATWYFAPMAGPDTKKGELISVGYTTDPRKIDNAATLCTEVAAQEKAETLLGQMLTSTQGQAVKLKALPLTSTSKNALTFTAWIGGKHQIIGRTSFKSSKAKAEVAQALAAKWRALGGTDVCPSLDCAAQVQVALPPLPLSRPAQASTTLPRLDSPTLLINELALLLDPAQ